MRFTRCRLANDNLCASCHEVQVQDCVLQGPWKKCLLKMIPALAPQELTARFGRHFCKLPDDSNILTPGPRHTLSLCIYWERGFSQWRSSRPCRTRQCGRERTVLNWPCSGADYGRKRKGEAMRRLLHNVLTCSSCNGLLYLKLIYTFGASDVHVRPFALKAGMDGMI